MSYHAILILLIICLLGCNSAKKNEQTPERLPNFIHIFTDDLGYGDLGCFGATDIQTPNIDRMADEGIMFTDFYSASSVCSPSRAGLLTGRLPQRMGINRVFFPESYTGMPQSEITIAELLKSKGFATGIVGKWHLGHHHSFLPLQQGFDSYFGIPYSNDMAGVVYMRDNEVESFEVNQRYSTKKFTEEAIHFIEEHKDRPFFLYFTPSMPHVPLYVSEDFEGTSERGLYGDVIQEIDWCVGEIIRKIEALGLSENTLIVFSSDNGPWTVMEEHGGSPGGLREGKMFTFEGGMRVPAVAQWIGKIEKGQVYRNLASQMDWFPTFAEITGIDLPTDRTIDGKDLSNVLFNKGERDDDTYLFFDGELLEGYRKGEWKVKMPYKGFAGARWKQAVAAHDTLLFNIKTDPGERVNLYHSSKQLAMELIDEMNAKYAEMGNLPPSLVVQIPEENSHYHYLEQKRKQN